LLFILTIIFCLTLTSISFSHGINYKIIKGGIGIEIKYDDGTPFSFSEAKVYSPSDKKTPYQEGFTDKNGRFIFFPDRKGKWKLVINDGMGHGVVKEIEIKERMKIETKLYKEWLFWQKLITGVSILWGLSGLILYLKIRKKIT
jgi:nickel transport protein